MKIPTGLIKLFSCCAIAFALMAPTTVHAEEPFATPQDSSEARSFIGEWAMTMDMGERKMNFNLKIVDMAGKVGGTIDSQRMPEPTAIDSFDMDDRGNLIMKFEMAMGPQSFKITLIAGIVPDGLEGKLNEASGLFSADFTAVEAFEDAETSSQRRRNRRAAANQTRLRLGEDTVRITFGPLKSDSEDYAKLSDTKSGDVFEFVGGRATKLFTDLDLTFGDTVVKTENAAPDYPGVYSLWLKKSGDGWSLVFNEEADIWGTMHNAEADAGEVPLTKGTLDEPAETFKVELKSIDGGGQIRILWGENVWTADFAAEEGSSQTAA